MYAILLNHLIFRRVKKFHLILPSFLSQCYILSTQSFYLKLSTHTSKLFVLTSYRGLKRNASARRRGGYMFNTASQLKTLKMVPNAAMSGAGGHKQLEQGEFLGPWTSATHYHAQLRLTRQNPCNQRVGYHQQLSALHCNSKCRVCSKEMRRELVLDAPSVITIVVRKREMENDLTFFHILPFLELQLRLPQHITLNQPLA